MSPKVKALIDAVEVFLHKDSVVRGRFPIRSGEILDICAALKSEPEPVASIVFTLERSASSDNTVHLHIPSLDDGTYRAVITKEGDNAE